MMWMEKISCSSFCFRAVAIHPQRAMFPPREGNESVSFTHNYSGIMNRASAWFSRTLDDSQVVPPHVKWPPHIVRCQKDIVLCVFMQRCWRILESGGMMITRRQQAAGTDLSQKCQKTSRGTSESSMILDLIKIWQWWWNSENSADGDLRLFVV